MNTPLQSWQFLAPLSPELLQARNQAHQALQALSMVGRSYLGADKEDQHANVAWDNSLTGFVGRAIPSPSGELRLALSLSAFRLQCLRENAQTELRLADKTWPEALDWTRQQLSAAGLDPAQMNIEQPYDIPTFPQTGGKAFGGLEAEAFLSLGRYFANAHAVLAPLVANVEEASELRCWPHHFDLATLIDLGEGRSIGIGLVPGDDEIPNPYFYANPWPAPDLEQVKLPTLAAGSWHREGWIGAVLKVEEILAQPNSQAQEHLARQYVSDALAHNRKLILGE